jgi:hypothetical protein
LDATLPQTGLRTRPAGLTSCPARPRPRSV